MIDLKNSFNSPIVIETARFEMIQIIEIEIEFIAVKLYSKLFLILKQQ